MFFVDFHGALVKGIGTIFCHGASKPLVTWAGFLRLCVSLLNFDPFLITVFTASCSGKLTWRGQKECNGSSQETRWNHWIRRNYFKDKDLKIIL